VDGLDGGGVGVERKLVGDTGLEKLEQIGLIDVPGDAV